MNNSKKQYYLRVRATVQPSNNLQKQVDALLRKYEGLITNDPKELMAQVQNWVDRLQEQHPPCKPLNVWSRQGNVMGGPAIYIDDSNGHTFRAISLHPVKGYL